MTSKFGPVFRFYSRASSLRPEQGFSLLTLLDFLKADVVVVEAYSDADVIQDDFLVPFLPKIQMLFLFEFDSRNCVKLWTRIDAIDSFGLTVFNVISTGIHNRFVWPSLIMAPATLLPILTYKPFVFHLETIDTFAMESRQLHSSFALAWAKSWLVERTWKSTW